MNTKEKGKDMRKVESWETQAVPFNFDAARMGEKLHAMRLEKCGRSPQDFIDFVHKRSGYKFSRNQIYAIEQGRQEMQASQLWAVCFALCGPRNWLEGVGTLMEAGYTPWHDKLNLKASLDEMKEAYAANPAWGMALLKTFTDEYFDCMTEDPERAKEVLQYINLLREAEKAYEDSERK